MAAGSGCARVLRCSYHGWEYSLDGRLKKAPGAEGIRSFCAQDIALKPIGLATQGHLLFLNFARSGTWALSASLFTLTMDDTGPACDKLTSHAPHKELGQVQHAPVFGVCKPVEDARHQDVLKSS